MEYSLPGSSVLGFLKQEYWAGLPLPLPVDLPDAAVEPASPALAGRFFPTDPQGSPGTRWVSTNFENILLFISHSVLKT